MLIDVIGVVKVIVMLLIFMFNGVDVVKVSVIVSNFMVMDSKFV